MNPYVKWGLIIGGGSAAVGGGYLLVRRYVAPPVPVVTTTTTTGTSTGGSGSSGSSSTSSGATTWKIPREMTGDQVALALGVSFASLAAANPGYTYMKAHPKALLAAGETFVVPAGGTIPASGSGLVA